MGGFKITRDDAKVMTTSLSDDDAEAAGRMLVEVHGEGHLGDATVDLADTKWRIFYYREIDVFWAGVGKDKRVLNIVLSSENGVFVMCRESDTIDARLHAAAAIVLRQSSTAAAYIASASIAGRTGVP